ncbi:MAG: acyltransferase [Clostridia bacterium]|nr:acyltransferase [Clostridia bacterium]
MQTATIGIKQKKNYFALDIVKFFCAVLIIAAHFSTERCNFSGLVDYAFSLYIFAVPFFFTCSGFLFFNNLNKYESKEEKFAYFKKYQKRLWIMYGCWSLVYFTYVVYYWIKKGVFGIPQFLKYLHMAVTIQTYSTIWFLPALAIGIAVTYYLVNRFSKKTILLIVSFLYLFSMLGASYNFVLEGTFLEGFFDLYLLVFKSSRNGLFNAVPFIFMGYLCTQETKSEETKLAVKDILLSILFIALTIVECVILKFKFDVSGGDVVLFLVPSSYYVVKLCVSIQLKENKIWLWMRNLSLLMFLSQRLFLTILIDEVPIFKNFVTWNGYFGLIVILTLIIAFSYCFIKLSKRIKLLKYFM